MAAEVHGANRALGAAEPRREALADRLDREPELLAVDGPRCRRAEMVDAVRDICRRVLSGEVTAEGISEETIQSALYTSQMPDPDLVIRTAGEMRVSNFLLWQISYAELWVTDKCWPEFRKPELVQAFKDFATRDRRFGGLTG